MADMKPTITAMGLWASIIVAFGLLTLTGLALAAFGYAFIDVLDGKVEIWVAGFWFGVATVLVLSFAQMLQQAVRR